MLTGTVLLCLATTITLNMCAEAWWLAWVLALAFDLCACVALCALAIDLGRPNCWGATHRAWTRQPLRSVMLLSMSLPPLLSWLAFFDDRLAVAACTWSAGLAVALHFRLENYFNFNARTQVPMLLTVIGAGAIPRACAAVNADMLLAFPFAATLLLMLRVGCNAPRWIADKELRRAMRIATLRRSSDALDSLRQLSARGEASEGMRQEADTIVTQLGLRVRLIRAEVPLDRASQQGLTRLVADASDAPLLPDSTYNCPLEDVIELAQSKLDLGRNVQKLKQGLSDFEAKSTWSLASQDGDALRKLGDDIKALPLDKLPAQGPFAKSGLTEVLSRLKQRVQIYRDVQLDLNRMCREPLAGIAASALKRQISQAQAHGVPQEQLQAANERLKHVIQREAILEDLNNFDMAVAGVGRRSYQDLETFVSKFQHKVGLPTFQLRPPTSLESEFDTSMSKFEHRLAEARLLELSESDVSRAQTQLNQVLFCLDKRNELTQFCRMADETLSSKSELLRFRETIDLARDCRLSALISSDVKHSEYRYSVCHTQLCAREAWESRRQGCQVALLKLLEKMDDDDEEESPLIERLHMALDDARRELVDDKFCCLGYMRLLTLQHISTIQEATLKKKIEHVNLHRENLLAHDQTAQLVTRLLGVANGVLKRVKERDLAVKEFFSLCTDFGCSETLKHKFDDMKRANAADSDLDRARENLNAAVNRDHQIEFLLQQLGTAVQSKQLSEAWRAAEDAQQAEAKVIARQPAGRNRELQHVIAQAQERLARLLRREAAEKQLRQAIKPTFDEVDIFAVKTAIEAAATAHEEASRPDIPNDGKQLAWLLEEARKLQVKLETRVEAERNLRHVMKAHPSSLNQLALEEAIVKAREYAANTALCDEADARLELAKKVQQENAARDEAVRELEEMLNSEFHVVRQLRLAEVVKDVESKVRAARDAGIHRQDSRSAELLGKGHILLDQVRERDTAAYMLREAMQGLLKNIDESRLTQAIDEARKARASDQLIETAVRALERVRKLRQTQNDLASAVEELQKLVALPVKTIELSMLKERLQNAHDRDEDLKRLDVSHMSSPVIGQAEKLVDRINARDSAAQQLRNAMCKSDIGGLQVAIEQARRNDVDDFLLADAEQYKSNLEKREAVVKRLRAAMSRSDVDELKKAIAEADKLVLPVDSTLLGAARKKLSSAERDSKQNASGGSAGSSSTKRDASSPHRQGQQKARGDTGGPSAQSGTSSAGQPEATSEQWRNDLEEIKKGIELRTKPSRPGDTSYRLIQPRQGKFLIQEAFKRFPPKTKSEQELQARLKALESVPDYSKEMLNELKRKFTLLYHPDKNRTYGEEWRRVCENLCQLANAEHDRLQLMVDID